MQTWVCDGWMGFLDIVGGTWGDEAVGGEAERVLQNVQGNLSRLTHRILMVQVEDLSEAMQRQVVGVPRAWVRLFRHLTNAVVCYHDTHPVPQA
jgi:hypothetical protein